MWCCERSWGPGKSDQGALEGTPSSHNSQWSQSCPLHLPARPSASTLWPLSTHICSFLFTDVGSVEGLAYHRGWDTLYWTSYTTSTITRHTVDQTRPGAFERETVITMSGDDHPRAFVLDECQK